MRYGVCEEDHCYCACSQHGPRTDVADAGDEQSVGAAAEEGSVEVGENVACVAVEIRTSMTDSVFSVQTQEKVILSQIQAVCPRSAR